LREKKKLARRLKEGRNVWSGERVTKIRKGGTERGGEGKATTGMPKVPASAKGQFSGLAKRKAGRLVLRGH